MERQRGNLMIRVALYLALAVTTGSTALARECHPFTKTSEAIATVVGEDKALLMIYNDSSKPILTFESTENVQREVDVPVTALDHDGMKFLTQLSVNLLKMPRETYPSAIYVVPKRNGETEIFMVEANGDICSDGWGIVDSQKLLDAVTGQEI